MGHIDTNTPRYINIQPGCMGHIDHDISKKLEHVQRHSRYNAGEIIRLHDRKRQAPVDTNRNIEPTIDTTRMRQRAFDTSPRDGSCLNVMARESVTELSVLFTRQSGGMTDTYR